jgi:hypothetical protein
MLTVGSGALEHVAAMPGSKNTKGMRRLPLNPELSTAEFVRNLHVMKKKEKRKSTRSALWRTAAERLMLSKRKCSRIYDVAEFDSHRIDLCIVVELADIKGGVPAT